MSKHTTSAVTEPYFLVPAFPVTNAVAFQPVSLANGSNTLISADPSISKLPLNAVSSGSHTAIEVMKSSSAIVPAVSYLQQYKYL